MALTKPRAYQIYDIDYKQAVRVVSISNVTLAGGAPNSVDGVNLSLNDRILVTGQTSGVQNGIYYVTTLGSGANGTWTRSTDTDATGELLSGTIVMVTEGTTYADTQWKLTTNDPITIGSTALTFVQNYLANSISYGGTAFAIGSSNANATISVAGTANVAVYATTGEYVTGLISATGNIIGGNLTTAGQVSSTGNLTSGNVLTTGQVSATGNVQGGNLVLTTGNLTLGNVNTFTSNSAIQGWSYPTVSLSISAADGTSTGIFFGNSGSSFYVVGTTNDRVFQYNMSSTNMANTGTVFGNVSVSTQDSTPGDLFIDSTGANLYVIGATNRVVYQYTMSTPWNITTASYASLSANISAQESAPTGLWFKPDLTTMYVVGTTNDTVYQYTLTTPGNVATATYASKSFSVTSQDSSPQAVNLSSDGSKMWVLGSTNTSIHEYNLGTAWDVSTATYSLGNSYSVRPQEATPTGLYTDLANARVWVVGQSSDTVFQYNTANSIIAQANAVGIQGQLGVQGNAYFGQFTNFQSAVAMESTLSVDSTLTGASGVTFSTTTSAINIGTSQTTGATIIGGTAQTANINIGRSTASQGIVIGNGVTASGSTKTIDIGTLGAANSATNINIGPTAGNAQVSFLSNAQVSIANTGGAALSVVGNITGGNISTAGLLSTTGNITSAANISGGNLLATSNVFGAGVSMSGNITGGNLLTGGLISATGNITSAANVAGGNVLATTIVSGASVLGSIVSASANITGGNLLTSGQVSATGNVTSAANVSGTYLLGNVFYATGFSASKIYNGTTEANIGTSGGNANISVGGTSNVAVFATTGEYVTGLISATGNITGANLVTTGLVASKDVSATGNAYVNGFISVTGNLYVANVVSQGNLIVEDPLLYLSANTPYPYNYDIGFFSQFQTSPGTPTQANGYQHTGFVRDQTDSVWKLFSNVLPEPGVTIDFTNAAYDTLLAGGISSTGNITATSNVAGGNLLATTTVSAASHIGSTVSVTANITGGNVLTSGIVSGASHIGSVVSVTANITGGNLLTGGLISATGNITSAGNISGSYILGNGSQLTGLPATYANANVAAYLASGTDTSNIITTANVSGGNVLATTIVSGASLLGSIVSASANITGGNILTGGIISGTGNATVGNISATIGSFTTFNSSQGGSVTGTLVATSANAQFFNQTNGSGYFTVAGYLSAAGNITSASNIAGGNLLITTTVSAASYIGSVASLSGNVTGGNLLTGGLISATGNVTSAANITGGNILTGGIVSATGNVTGRYFIGNANVQYTASTTPPTGNLIGAQWYDTSTDVLYEWQTDGTSSYWVDITGPIIGSNGAAAGTTLTNGTSNISVALNGNASVNIAGTPNVAVFATDGEYVTGSISASGNITSAANISGGNLILTGITTATGTITTTGTTNGTAFAVGNGAVSNVALGFFPTAGTAAAMAIRDYSTVASTIYLDVGMGSANTNSNFIFRGSNAFTQYAKIDQYGVNQPTRPAFRVYGNTSTNFTTGTTLTNQVIDYNQGSNYVNSTGIFTAPVAGLYSVWLNARAGATASLSQIGVFKNNDTSGANVVCFWEITTSATTTTHFGVSSVVKLAAGDTLRAKVVAGGVNFDGNDNWGAAYIG